MLVNKNGSQIVRTIQHGSLAESYWVIFPPDNTSRVYQGQPIKCGNEIKLKHMATRGFLASDRVDADYSHGKNVFATTEDLPNTVWTVSCAGRWDASQEIYLQNSETGYYLNANKDIKIPIHEGGDFDCYASETKSNAAWVVGGGLFVDEKEEYDEQ